MSKRLRDEIKQMRPFASLEQEAFSHRQDVGVLDHAMAEALKPTGSRRRSSTCCILRGAGEEGLCRGRDHGSHDRPGAGCDSAAGPDGGRG